MIEVDLDELKQEIIRLGTENPGRVYETRESQDGASECRYIEEDGTPGCIFGNAFLNLGVPPEAIEPHEGTGIDAVLTGRSYWEMDDDDPRKPTIDRFYEVQSAQDSSEPWGEAVSPLLKV